MGLEGEGWQRRSNLSSYFAAQRYLDRLGLGSGGPVPPRAGGAARNPAYREANAGALRMEWPRIPLPGWPDAGDVPGAADELAASAARGRELARLLDPETPAPGVTAGPAAPGAGNHRRPATADGRNMTGDDFALTAGWGHFGTGDAVMPGQGRAVERPCTAAEREALGDATATLGDATLDIHLNDRAYWRNVPAAVWNYKLGGYQVLKKWLSYRESIGPGPQPAPEEVQHFTETARRIGAILLAVAGKWGKYGRRIENAGMKTSAFRLTSRPHLCISALLQPSQMGTFSLTQRRTVRIARSCRLHSGDYTPVL